MTIVELGALGEFIAAIAVVASLIYVGIQLAQSRVQMRANAAQARTDSFVSMQALLMAIPELMEARLKAERGAELSETDEYYLSNELQTRTIMLENWFYQRKLGQLEKSMSKRLDHLLILRRTEFSRSWWSQIKGGSGFSNEFIDHVNDVLAQYES